LSTAVACPYAASVDEALIPADREESRNGLSTEPAIVYRRATPSDLDGICAVAEAVRLDAGHAQEGGFLVYVHDRQEYADRLAASDLFYVAIDRGEVIGFLVCFDDRTTADLVARGVESDYLLRARAVAGCEGRWVCADQLATHPAHTKRGIGVYLVWAIFHEIRRRGIGSVFARILHDPPNSRAKAFCETLGFVFRGVLPSEDGRPWGIYSRNVPGVQTG
jgi:GNAT superfamily N-acetyltransferase